MSQETMFKAGQIVVNKLRGLITRVTNLSQEDNGDVVVTVQIRVTKREIEGDD